MEKFNKKVVEMVIEGIKENCDQLMEWYDDAISNLKCADTINDVMEAKQELMSDIVSVVPIRSDTCYFCLYFQRLGLKEEEACKGCSYGKAHGKCGSRLFGGDEENTWKTMNKLKKELQDFIEKNYWTGGEMKSGKHKRPKDI